LPFPLPIRTPCSRAPILPPSIITPGKEAAPAPGNHTHLQCPPPTRRESVKSTQHGLYFLPPTSAATKSGLRPLPRWRRGGGGDREENHESIRGSTIGLPSYLRRPPGLPPPPRPGSPTLHHPRRHRCVPPRYRPPTPRYPRQVGLRRLPPQPLRHPR
jgi:hypothetical protein